MEELDDDFFYSTKIGKYTIENSILGLGRFGTVKIGTIESTSIKVAVKIIQKIAVFEEETLKYDQEDVFKEIRIMERLKECHLIQLLDYYENRTQLCLVLELAEGGDLMSLVEKKGRLSESAVLEYCRDIVMGLSFMHSCAVAHRDVKAENVLVCSDGRLKLTDFGFSVEFDRKGRKKIVTRCGTLFYVAPEILKGKGHVGPEVDVWALGVLIYFMMTGHYPFSGICEFDIASAIKNINYPDHPHLTDGAKDLIAQLFVPLKYRTDIDNLKNHPWVYGKKGATYKESIRRSDPSKAQKRISCHSGSLSTLIDETFSDSESSFPSQGAHRQLSSSQRKLVRSGKRCTGAELRASLRKVKKKTRSRTFYHETREDAEDSLFIGDVKTIHDTENENNLDTSKYFRSLDYKMNGKKQKKKRKKKRKGTIELYRQPVPVVRQKEKVEQELEPELVLAEPKPKMPIPQLENNDTDTELVEFKKSTRTLAKSSKISETKKTKKYNSENEKEKRKKSPLENSNVTESESKKPHRTLSGLKSRKSDTYKKSKYRYSEVKKRHSEKTKKRKSSFKRHGSEKDSGSESKGEVKNRDFLKKSRKILSARKEEKKIDKKRNRASSDAYLDTDLPSKRRRKKSNTLTSENRPVFDSKRFYNPHSESKSEIETTTHQETPLPHLPNSSASIHEPTPLRTSKKSVKGKHIPH